MSHCHSKCGLQYTPVSEIVTTSAVVICEPTCPASSNLRLQPEESLRHCPTLLQSSIRLVVSSLTHCLWMCLTPYRHLNPLPQPGPSPAVLRCNQCSKWCRWPPGYMQWRQHEHGRMQQDAQLMSTEQERAQPCCSADEAQQDEGQQAEEAAAHKVVAVHDHMCHCRCTIEAPRVFECCCMRCVAQHACDDSGFLRGCPLTIDIDVSSQSNNPGL